MKRQKSRWIFSHLLKRSSVLSHPFAIPCVVTQPWGKNELWFLSVSLKSKETFFNVLKDVSSCSLFFFFPAPFIERAKSVFPFQSIFSCTFCLSPTQICTATPKHSLCLWAFSEAVFGCTIRWFSAKTILFSRNGSGALNRQECAWLWLHWNLPISPICRAGLQLRCTVSTRWHSVTTIFWCR